MYEKIKQICIYKNTLGCIHTVWKFHDFPITQNLREINFGEIQNSKTPVYAYFEALDFVNLVNFNLQKEQKFLQNHNSGPLNVLEWQILHFENPQISFYVKSK